MEFVRTITFFMGVRSLWECGKCDRFHDGRLGSAIALGMWEVRSLFL
ncbi:MAG: hypothetical protein KME31_34370 [Tolypothrix carrinoi HA7290-LM1]|nr:hypothetical protein [Tolypothrix carrinoi HA7290-LM1]